MKPSNLIFDSRRSAVHGTHGMIACSQPLAAQVGMDVLKNGGNAADAAVAIGFALTLLEPGSSSIAGGTFCLYYDSKARTVKGLDGSGRTPSALTYDLACQDPVLMDRETKRESIHTITVPATLAAYDDILKHFGSNTVSLADAISPTIEMAERGFPVGQVSASSWRSLLTKKYLSKSDWAIDGTRGPEEGEIVTMPCLAKTYKQIALEGIEALYKGSIGENIIQVLQSYGSVMTMEDLANHSSELFDPISIDYRGSTVWQVPPVSQGITTLMALGIIEALEENHIVDFSKIEYNSSEYIHVVTEALRLAFSDTIRYVSDASTTTVPVDMLLNKDYLRERAKLIDLERKNDNVQNGYPDLFGGTTYISVVDSKGNACSLMSSFSMGFLAAPPVPGTGITLDTRGEFFSLEKDHPNAIGPSKKSLHTIMPSIMTRKTEDGHELEASFGIMGAFMQHQGLLHFILNIKHYTSNPQRILDLPRICISPTKEKYSDANNLATSSDSIIFLENGFSEEIAKSLESKGHICTVVSQNANVFYGRGQVIFSRADPKSGRRVLTGGSEPRTDGQVVAW